MSSDDSREARLHQQFGVAAEEFIGLSLSQAADLAARHGILLRVLGSGRRTDDLVKRRVNVEVDGARVVRVDGVY